MPSSFTWLDYSEADRRKMLDVINAFREKETRDELGLGSVRDAFANQLFPGTSTIQTRARYFLFVPWIYLRLERDSVHSHEVAHRARRDEIRLIEALIKGGEIGEGSGVIGAYARAQLQRLPSSVYWFGLASLGIRLFGGSLDQYHRSLDRFYEVSRQRRSMRGHEEDLLDEPLGANWHPNLPPAPPDLLDRATFALTAEEADYLSDRIRVRQPSSLLRFLLDVDSSALEVAFPWEHPDLDQFPALLREQLTHACHFSEVMHGAPLLYNLMLAELTGYENRKDHYHARIQEWARQLTAQRTALEHWDLNRFWEIVCAQGARVTPQSRHFIETWIDQIRQPQTLTAAADQTSRLRELVRRREVALKRRLSRFENPRARELWNGQSGLGQLSYRWGSARRLLSDLHASMTER